MGVVQSVGDVRGVGVVNDDALFLVLPTASDH